MRVTIFIFLLVAGFAARPQINIVPMPAAVTMGKGSFDINRNTVIVLEGSGLEKSASFFNIYLQKHFGYKLKIVNKYAGANSITLNYERLDHEIPGAYNLSVDNKGIYIAGDNEAGVFYGIQSLIQLLPEKNAAGAGKNYPLSIQQLSITDHPRFAYRGMHLDVGRHLFPVDFIKKYIDYLAYHKFNNFHWHLTEDQGWRIEIKKYPLLTTVGSCRDRTLTGRYGSNKYDSTKYCGYYTQEQIKEIVKYAAGRYINIIPEIEMPGHSTAALASYPYLGCTKGPYKVLDTWGVLEDVYCAGNDSTFTFLQNVLDEVMQLFPSKYIHIGGDECPKERWKLCPLCQKRIKDLGLKDEHALQSYFITRIEKYLNSKGRKIIGWDEILEGGLAPNATVMSWRGEEGGIEAVKQNHDVIMTPGSHCYIDHSQSKNEDSITIGGYLPLEKVYSYEPIPASLNTTQAKHVLGAQGNVWTEYMDNTAKVEYMIFPRMSALSEVLWTPKEKRNYADFERRLPEIFNRYQNWGANYSKAYYDLSANVLPIDNGDGIIWKLESKNPTDNICISAVSGSNDEFIKRTPAIFAVKRNAQLKATICKEGQAKTYITQNFSFNKATGKKITLVLPPHKSYPGDGAFTLVNAVQNEKGLAKSNEFLGFLGTDLDATIDLGTITNVSKIVIHTLDQNGSWIYLPKEIEVSFIPYIDTTVIANHTPVETIMLKVKDENNLQIINLPEAKTCRYIRVLVKNFGMIPSGKPGAGNPAWLFVEEIEVE